MTTECGEDEELKYRNGTCCPYCEQNPKKKGCKTKALPPKFIEITDPKNGKCKSRGKVSLNKNVKGKFYTRRNLIKIVVFADQSDLFPYQSSTTRHLPNT